MLCPTLAMDSYLIVIAVLVVPTLTQVPPGSPIIFGPDTIMLGEIVTLTCRSIGGNPTPTVSWFRDDTVIIDGTTTQTVNGVTTTNVTFTATLNEHLEVFECQTDNQVLQNPLSLTKFVEVYFTPEEPTLVGPTLMTSGTAGTWMCSSFNGYPPPTMTMRVDHTQFSSDQFSVTRFYNVTTKSYTLIGVLSWAPTAADDNRTLYCDVSHPATIATPQTVSLQLTVNGTDPLLQQLLLSDGLSWGEIIAIILGIFFFLLLMVICCCLQAWCCGFCCASNATIERDDEKRILNIHTLETIEQRSKSEYEITQYHVLRPEDFIDEQYMTAVPQRRQYFPHNKYTYYEEERRRQQWKNKKKKMKKSGHVMNDKEQKEINSNMEQGIYNLQLNGTNTSYHQEDLIVLEEKGNQNTDATSLSSISGDNRGSHLY